MTALRELAERLIDLAARWNTVNCNGMKPHECASEILQILDAEGDVGAVGYVCPDGKITFYMSDGWSIRVPPGTELYAKSQGSSDPTPEIFPGTHADLSALSIQPKGKTS